MRRAERIINLSDTGVYGCPEGECWNCDAVGAVDLLLRSPRVGDNNNMAASRALRARPYQANLGAHHAQRLMLPTWWDGKISLMCGEMPECRAYLFWSPEGKWWTGKYTELDKYVPDRVYARPTSLIISFFIIVSIDHLRGAGARGPANEDGRLCPELSSTISPRAFRECGQGQPFGQGVALIRTRMAHIVYGRLSISQTQ